MVFASIGIVVSPPFDRPVMIRGDMPDAKTSRFGSPKKMRAQADIVGRAENAGDNEQAGLRAFN
jgi:hypothetical protein